MPAQWELSRLNPPQGMVDAVLDTDTYNEIDDQFALSLLVKSPERINLRAIYAAPFYNDKSTGPADGMEKSYQEILHLLGLLGRTDLESLVFRGSDQYLPGENEPVISDAACHLVKLGMEYSAEKPLYVVAIGAITNIASALLMEPELINRIVVVWLGGHALEWHDNQEFNLAQDIAAARIIFGCGVPLVQLPCMGVVSAFSVTGPELVHWLRGKNALCDYLVDITTSEGEKWGASRCWSRAIWDVTAVAWLLEGDFTLSRLEHSPIPEYDHHYSFDKRRHFIRYVYHIDRDRLMAHLFDKLST